MYALLTGKQRSYLKGKANTMDSIFQLGKDGITDNFVIQIDEALEARELIKVNVLDNNLLEAGEVANDLAKQLDAEFVQNIGNKFVLYRESKENKKISLPK